MTSVTGIKSYFYEFYEKHFPSLSGSGLNNTTYIYKNAWNLPWCSCCIHHFFDRVQLLQDCQIFPATSKKSEFFTSQQQE